MYTIMLIGMDPGLLSSLEEAVSLLLSPPLQLVKQLYTLLNRGDMHLIMNAQERRTLTATCMHIAWLTLCMFNIRSIELHTLHLNRVLVYY